MSRAGVPAPASLPCGSHLRYRPGHSPRPLGMGRACCPSNPQPLRPAAPEAAPWAAAVVHGAVTRRGRLGWADRHGHATAGHSSHFTKAHRRRAASVLHIRRPPLTACASSMRPDASAGGEQQQPEGPSSAAGKGGSGAAKVAKEESNTLSSAQSSGSDNVPFSRPVILETVEALLPFSNSTGGSLVNGKGGSTNSVDRKKRGNGEGSVDSNTADVRAQVDGYKKDGVKGDAESDESLGAAASTASWQGEGEASVDAAEGNSAAAAASESKAPPSSAQGRSETGTAGEPRVPWGWQKIIQVMLLWVFAFWLLGNWLVPLGMELLELGNEDLTARGQAVVHLMVDLSELALTLGILWWQLRAYRPRKRGWFPIRLRGKWIFQVLAACLLFPVVDWVALQSQTLFPSEDDEWAVGLEQSLSGGDPITNVLYFIVVSVCAPIWEEAIFRGFLLPSLTRYFPVVGSVVISSMCFAMAHFSIQRFFPLVFLGIVMGTVYVRTGNLLSCMTLHSLWNLYIFYQLAARGIM